MQVPYYGNQGPPVMVFYPPAPTDVLQICVRVSRVKKPSGRVAVKRVIDPSFQRWYLVEVDEFIEDNGMLSTTHSRASSPTQVCLE